MSQVLLGMMYFFLFTVHLVYIVEADLKKAETVVEEYKLHETTKVLHFDDISVALSDKK